MSQDRCDNCPARKFPFVPSEINQGARLIVIGEAPGRSEAEDGKPFIGASGRLMKRGLRSIGLGRQGASWLNAIGCYAPLRFQKDAVRACAGRAAADLTAALGGARDPVIAPLGAFGLQATLGTKAKPQILKWRGSVSRSPTGILIAPTVHPAFVLRSPGWAPVLEIDVARWGRLLADPAWAPPEDQEGRRFVVAQTGEAVREALTLLEPEVSFDVETVGLGPTSTDLVCFGLSDGRLTVVIPWSLGRNGLDPWWDGSVERPKASVIAAMVTAALAGRVTVTHNGPAFDFVVAARYGIRFGAWEDTLLGAHATSGHLPKNLAHVVTTAGGVEDSLDVPPWKMLEDRTATLERLWSYNGRDCLYTILAWQRKKRELGIQ